MLNANVAYRRILLKLSGEALGKADPALSLASSASKSLPIHSGTLSQIARDIATLVDAGVQLGIVVGGGNWFRGAQGGPAIGLNCRISSDYIGMLATIMNAFILRNALEQEGLADKLMSALPNTGLVDPFEAYRAKRWLSKQYVLVFAGGTGHPLVSTDAAASLRALETEADILLKATSVEGVYSADPFKDPKAKLYQQLSYQEVLRLGLNVMDLAAFCQCRDHNLPIRVFNIHTPQGLVKIAQGEAIGTLISS